MVTIDPVSGGFSQAFKDTLTSLFGYVSDGIGIFNTAPLNYFVYLALVGGAIVLARKILPRKRG